MKKIFALLLLALPVTIKAQETTDSPKPYWSSASEFIFSFGMVEDDNLDSDPSSILRFSMFFHFQEQMHIDLSDKVGIFTGFGVRNVGMINDIEYMGETIKLKQRSYSFGIPIALKLGNMKDRNYIALGAEAELMFNYKQKAFYDDTKYKKTSWFSDRTNLINPSVFMDINFKKGAYVRFKYYLLDFLNGDKQSLSVDGVDIPYSPEKSQLFYIALGLNLSHKEMKKQLDNAAGTLSSY